MKSDNPIVVHELTKEEIDTTIALINKLNSLEKVSAECRKFIDDICMKLYEAVHKPYPGPALNNSDKIFAIELSKKFDIQIETIESYLLELQSILIESSRKLVEIENLLGRVDYYYPPSTESERLVLKVHISAVLFISYNLNVQKFKKYVIAGLVILHYKFDKYERILTENEFLTHPHLYQAQDYQHYIYDRMKTKFKTFRKRTLLGQKGKK